MKKVYNYSPNFDFNKRKSKQIKFLIFHYTGMRKESDAIERLTNIQSEVSSHYLIKKNGEIVVMVPDIYVAWHAGKSFWKNFKSLNKNSIGIEITNPGHEYGYKKFTQKQIASLKKILRYLSKKYKIKKENILGHSDISPDRKKDPGERFPWQKLAKENLCQWHNLNKIKLKRFRKIKSSSKQKEEFLINLSKIGYRKVNQKETFQNNKILTTAFQRRFRQELIDGQIDKECYIISKKLINY
jgi:N-acetylmuramoyl-L-alanine amidase